MQKRALSFLFLSGMLSLASLPSKGQSCTTCTYTSTGGNTTYNLNSGETLCINSGTFTGNVNVNGDVTICINSGAVFQPSAFNNFKGNSVLNNYGTFRMSSGKLDGGTFNNFGSFEATNNIGFDRTTINNNGSFAAASVTFDNSTINNYNFLHFSNNINMNVGTRWLNHSNAYARYDRSFSINTNATFTNQGTQEFYGDLTVADNNSFTNLGRLNTYGSLNLYGNFTNGGIAVARGAVSIHRGRTTNNCRFVITNSFNNVGNNTLENNSLLWVTGTNQFQTSGAITNTGYIRTGSYTASGTVTNTGGQIVVTGSSISSGTLTGGMFSDVGNAANGYRFDSQSGTMTATTGYIELKDTLDMGTSSCAFVSLPVRVVAFNATQINAQSVQLKWLVAEEADLHSYIVEQLIASNGDWKAIAAVWPTAQAGEKVYNYTDKIAVQGKVQYRLKIVNNDGTIAYSAVKSILPSSVSATTVSLYPNPVVNQLTVAGIGTEAYITLFGLDGKTILSTIRVRGAVAQVDMTTLKAGVYLVKIQQQGVVSYHKVVRR